MTCPIFVKIKSSVFKDSLHMGLKSQAEISSRDKKERSNKNKMELKYFKDLEVICNSGIGIAPAESLAVRILVLTSCGFCMSCHFSKMQEPRLVTRVRGMG